MPSDEQAAVAFCCRFSAITRRLLPPGTPVRLTVEPATKRFDPYGGPLRYARVHGNLNINIRLVAVGAAAPYFYAGCRGHLASLLERLALHARSKRLGLWGRRPGTPYHPTAGVNTGPA